MDLLVVPPKKASEVDLVKPLKNLMQNPNNKGDSPNIEKINNFNKQRNQAVFKVFEKTEAALDQLYAWVDLLFPVHVWVS